MSLAAYQPSFDDARRPSLASVAQSLSLRAPGVVTVGRPLRVRVFAHGADALRVDVALVTAAGMRPYSVLLSHGEGLLTILPSDTRVRGRALLVAEGGGRRTNIELELEPGPPVDPVVPIVGARSTTADGRQWSMAVIIPVDRLGNTVAEGTRVDVDALHPGEVHESLQTEVRYQVAWQRIHTRTLAGRTTVTAHCEGQHGPESSFDEVPGWPASYSVSADTLGGKSDGRTFALARAGPVVDEFGNVMLDGTLVTFLGHLGDEARVVPSFTIGGVARALVQSPRAPSLMNLGVSFYGRPVSPIELAFGDGPAIGDIPIRVRVDRVAGSVTIDCGPLLGALRQFAAEGLPFSGAIWQEAARIQPLAFVASQGYARAIVRSATLAPGDYRVTVELGAGHGETQFSID